jgi:small conductance mechanosensitive channel
MVTQTSVFDSAAWQWFLGKPLQVLVVVVLTFFVRSALVRLISRLTARTVEMRHAGSADRSQQRANSISQLLRSIITIVLWSISTITILSIFGINVAPLLTSAGVIGVGLGFGAQTLVKDYLAGIFLIIEDQYGVGDLVDVGPVVGTVDEVGLRVTRIKDEQGVIWYVRNGEILRVANQSQGA